MNVRIEDLNSVKKKLFIEVPGDVVTAELENAYKKIAKSANIKGFRKGKVPRSILEQHYGPKAEYDTVGALINVSLYKALLDEKIEAVAQPQVVNTGDVVKDQVFQYEAEVEIRPEVVVNEYKGLQLEKEIPSFDDAEVDRQLERMAESKSQLVVTDRKKAREGDTVIIDFEGFVDGVAFKNGSATDYQLELGSNSFIPGFEDQVAGMKREQEKDVEVSFPESYGAKELAGKPAVFKVLLKEIKEKQLPAMDDELAKEFDAETLAELKARLQEQGEKQEQQRIEGQLHEAMMTALIEKNAFEIPDAMVDNQLRYMKDSFAQRLQAQGMTLEMLGMNDETFFTSYRDMAAMQVKGELILDAIANQEKLTIEDSELEAKMQSFADESNAPIEQVQKYFENEQAKAGLKGQILQDKVTKLVLDQAVITEVEPKQDDAEVATEDGEDA